MVAALDRSTKLTAKGDTPSLEFQVLWQALRRELARLARDGRVSVRALSASGAAIASDFLLNVDATAGAVTVTLPLAADSLGAHIVVKKVDASGNAVTVDGAGAETIDGAATASLAAQYDSIAIVCDGYTWWRV